MKPGAAVMLALATPLAVSTPGAAMDEPAGLDAMMTSMHELAKYRDCRVAEADGCKPLHPELFGWMVHVHPWAKDSSQIRVH